ncbi:hypothetical protein Bca4012_086571 [Brassica carinata]
MLVSKAIGITHVPSLLRGSKYKIEFVCTGMVTDIKLEKSWCYVSCPRCTKKLQRTVSSLRDLQ